MHSVPKAQFGSTQVGFFILKKTQQVNIKLIMQETLNPSLIVLKKKKIY